MPVSVVVGGQFGSEGKGKVAHYFAREQNARMVVRVGGSNSGHTVIDQDGNPQIFRHLPTACILPDPICVIPAGAYIDPDVLLEEIRRVNLPDHRLIIDPKAVLITDADKQAEAKSGLGENIGSTLSGTGAAVIKRIQRRKDCEFVGSHEKLKKYVHETVPLMREELDKKQRIIIEGTQGFGLSVLHTPHFPYATSRDTTAAGFVAEVGLSPLDVDEVILVIRTFPIRVPGNSGPLPNEINWQSLKQESNSRHSIHEYTSVSKKLRRVAIFDKNIVINSVSSNNPTTIVLNHLDYVDYYNHYSTKVIHFVQSIQKSINRFVDYTGHGPDKIYKFLTSARGSKWIAKVY